MAFSASPIAHGGVSLGIDGGTYDNGGSGLNTTGADFFIAAASHTVGTAPTGVSDNKAFTWNPLTDRQSGDSSVRLFWAAGTGGTGHTFTCARATAYIAFYVAAFSGGHASPADQEGGSASGSGATSLATASITPSEGNCLVVAGLGSGSTGSSVTGTNLAIIGQINGVGGQSYSVALAYVIQSSAAAISETFNWTGAYYAASAIADFKSAAGGGGGAFPHPYYQRLRQRQRFVKRGQIFVPAPYARAA